MLIKNKISFLCLLFTIPFMGFGQNLVVLDTVPVEEFGTTLTSPMAGGLNLPEFSTMDLNGDSWLDLVVFDKEGDKLLTFINQGGVGNASYIHEPAYQEGFPDDLTALALMFDYNCDGKEDIFSWNNGGVKVYKNTSSGGVTSFAVANPQLQSQVGANLIPIFLAQSDIPAIVDLDGDTDLDILTFDGGGSFIEFHRNTSIENTGTCDNLTFELADACWGKFSEDGFNNTLYLNNSCKGITGGVTNPQGVVHSGSTIAVFDEDGDGALDAFIGDLAASSLVMAHNGATTVNALMDTAIYGFPSYNTPVDLYIFPATYFIDINNDGRKDMLNVANSPNISVNYEGVWYYQNGGTGAQSNFNLTEEAFLQADMIDVGTMSLPAFFDHNGDGLLDLLIGNYTFKTSNSSTTSGITLYENNGTATSPSFRLITRDYGNFSTNFSPTAFGLAPAFGDMDADGDEDLVLGDFEGRLHYFENTAGAGNTASFASPIIGYKGIDVGANAVPQIADINRDGKPDLVVGELAGNLNYFENTGTSTAPDFPNNPTDASWGGVDTQPLCCSGFSVPFLTENIITGKWDLYVGAEAGNVYYYANVEASLGGNFPLTDSTFGGFDADKRAALCGADLNGDNQMEWALGNVRGGITLYGPEVITGIESNEDALVQARLYPNPSNGSATVIAGDGQAAFHVYNAMGQVLLQQTTENGIGRLELPDQAAGIYYVKVFVKGKQQVIRWVIQ